MADYDTLLEREKKQKMFDTTQLHRESEYIGEQMKKRYQQPAVAGAEEKTNGQEDIETILPETMVKVNSKEQKKRLKKFQRLAESDYLKYRDITKKKRERFEKLLTYGHKFGYYFFEIPQVENFSAENVCVEFVETQSRLEEMKTMLELVQNNGYYVTDNFRKSIEPMERMCRKAEEAMQYALKAVGMELEEEYDDKLHVKKSRDRGKYKEYLAKNHEAVAEMARIRSEMLDIKVGNLMDECREHEEKKKEDWQDKVSKEHEQTGILNGIELGNIRNQEQLDLLLELNDFMKQHKGEAASPEKEKEIGIAYTECLRAVQMWAYAVEDEQMAVYANKRITENKYLQDIKDRISVPDERRTILLKQRARALLEHLKGEFAQNQMEQQELSEQERESQISGEKIWNETLRHRKLAEGAGYYLKAREQTDLKPLLELVQQTKQEKQGEELTQFKEKIREVIAPYVERIWNFNTRDFNETPFGVLAENNEQLQKLAAFTAPLQELVKYIGIDREAVFELKCSRIESYATLARVNACMEACAEGVVEGCLTEEELGMLKEKAQREYNRDDLPLFLVTDYFAELRYQANQSMGDAVEHFYASGQPNPGELVRTRHVAQSKEYTSKVREFYIQTHFKDMDETLREKKITGLADETCYGYYYDQQQKKAEELKERIENGEGETEELQKKYKTAQQEAAMAQTMRGIMYGHLHRADDLEGESLLKEPLARTFQTIDQMPAFGDVLDEEFYHIMGQIAAGDMERRKVWERKLPLHEYPAEQFEEYYAINKQGYAAYKEKIKQNYEQLDALLQHKIPSFEFFQEHFEEISKYFGNLQVDLGFVSLAGEVIDLTKPEDMRLNALVTFYNQMAFEGGFALEKISRQTKTTAFGYAAFNRFYNKKCEWAANYLNTGKLEETLPEEKVLRFRKLAEDAEMIMHADPKVYPQFLEKAEELKNYTYEQEQQSITQMREKLSKKLEQENDRKKKIEESRILTSVEQKNQQSMMNDFDNGRKIEEQIKKLDQYEEKRRTQERVDVYDACMAELPFCVQQLVFWNERVQRKVRIIEARRKYQQGAEK